MKIFFLLIWELFSYSVIEIPGNEIGCDRRRTPMCTNEFGICPLGSTFHEKVPIKRTDICNLGPLATEIWEMNGMNGTCVCNQHEDSRVPGYGYVFVYNECIRYSQCCSNNNAELKIIDENGEKKYTCVCKEGFEQSTFKDFLSGVTKVSCTRKCPENEEFTSCMASQVHCSPQPTPRICLHGCACKAGYKRAGRQCIKAEDCPVCGDGAVYMNPPRSNSLSLGPVYVPKEDKYGGMCQCVGSKAVIAGGQCYDEEAICKKFGGVYYNSKFPVLKTTKNCVGKITSLMFGRCSCPSGYVFKGSSDAILIT